MGNRLFKLLIKESYFLQLSTTATEKDSMKQVGKRGRGEQPCRNGVSFVRLTFWREIGQWRGLADVGCRLRATYT
jgi:hypothetical protein